MLTEGRPSTCPLLLNCHYSRWPHASGNLYTWLPTNLNLPAERIHVAASFTREIAQVEGFTIPDFPPLQFWKYTEDSCFKPYINLNIVLQLFTLNTSWESSSSPYNQRAEWHPREDDRKVDPFLDKVICTTLVFPHGTLLEDCSFISMAIWSTGVSTSVHFIYEESSAKFVCTESLTLPVAQ